METMLAMVLGAMVLMGSLGVFLSLRNMENAFAARFERTSELDITHTIFTRAMLSLQMQETQANIVTRAQDSQADTQEITELEPDPRYRMILETDLAAGSDSTGWIPQRLELVNATPPVPFGLATQAAGWYVAQDQSESLNFSAMDGSQGIVRGVFELRPTGQRERMMHELGLISANDLLFTDPIAAKNPPNQSDTKPNWTLWWRPILSYEAQQLLYGQGPFSDTTGTPDEIRARLAGAVPLMRHIERCAWTMFKADELVTTFVGLSMSDLPAYAQFEISLTNGQYASWMFEIDWVLGDDPSTDLTGAGSGLADGADNTENDNGRPGRPDGQIDPNATRTINFSDNN